MCVYVYWFNSKIVGYETTEMKKDVTRKRFALLIAEMKQR
jgi:hypothetical protein